MKSDTEILETDPENPDPEHIAQLYATESPLTDLQARAYAYVSIAGYSTEATADNLSVPVERIETELETVENKIKLARKLATTEHIVRDYINTDSVNQVSSL